MSHATRIIQRYLADLGRRAAVLRATRRGGLFLSGAALLALGLMLAAPSLPVTAALRLASLAMLGAGFVGFALLLVRDLVRLRRPGVQARLVGRRSPKLLSDLLSTVELASRPDDARAPYSSTLFGALARSTARRLLVLAPGSILPARALRGAAVLLSVASVSWALAAVVAPQRLARGADLVLWPHAAAGQIKEAQEPLVGDLALTYKFPAYLSRTPRQVSSSTGQISAPRGTRVELSTRTMIPTARATLLLTEEGASAPRSLALTLSGGTRLAGTILVSEPGTYRFRIETAAGRVLLDPVERRVAVEADAYPGLTLYAPADDTEVTDRSQVELGFIVEDDHGLKEVRLAYQIGGDQVRRRILWKPKEGETSRSATGKQEWDLGDADLRPGARVTYWLEAMDNDTVSGPKVAQSRPRYLKVYSPELKHQVALALMARALEHGIRVLADRLLLFAPRPPLAPSLRFDKAARVHKAQLTLRDALREVSNQLRADPMATPSLRRSVSRIMGRLSPLSDAEATQIKALRPLRRRLPFKEANLRGLAERNRKLTGEMERAVLQLADLLDEQRLKGLGRLAQELKEGRKRLKELLDRYKKAPSEALKRKILRLISQLEAKAREMMARAAKLQGTIPDEYLNTEAMGKLDVNKQLRQLSEQLRQGKMDKLDSALSALDRSLQQLEGMLGAGARSFRGGRMQGQERQFSETMDRLRGLEREQRKLAARTSKVIRRYRKKASELMKRTIEPFIRKQQARLKELRRRVGEIQESGLSAYDQGQLQRVKQRLEELDGLLAQSDLDEGLRNARRARNGLRMLEDDLGEELEDPYAMGRANARKNHRRSRGARKLADELVADLEAIFPSAGSILDGADRKELQRLQRQQQELRRAAKKLQGRLGKEGKEMPFFSPELMKKLSGAGQQMGKARGKLRSMKLQESRGHQEAAADALARAQDDLKGARKPQRVRGDGTNGPRERVKIPGADAFRPPREFREDILEAMKERAPALFEDLVKRYYEELVR